MKSRFRFRSSLAGTIFVSFAASGFAAADTNWLGTTSQDWSTASNWSNGVPVEDGAQGAVTINVATGNFPEITAAGNYQADWDIIIGGAAAGRLDQSAGTLATGNGNWFFLGWQGGQATYNLADTSGSGGSFTGFGQGQGSLSVGGLTPTGDKNLFIGLDAATQSVMNIHTIGAVTAGGVYLGSNGASTGTLNMDSGTVTATGETQVGASYFGNGGTGIFNMSGGSYASNIFSIGRGSNNAAAISGTATLTGGTLTSNQWFTLGFAGSATNTAVLTNNGGSIRVNATGGGNMELGVWDPTVNTVNQNSGALSIQNNASILMGVLGHNGTSTFHQNGGSVTFYSDAGATVGGTGALTLGSRGGAAWEISSGTYAYNLNGGTLTVPKIDKTSGNGTGTFNFNGGTLIPTASSATFMQGLSAANVRDGGAAIDTAGFDITIGQGLAHSLIDGDADIDGGLVKSGPGTLTLTGLNDYTGETAVNEGRLVFANSPSYLGDIRVADGARLDIRTAADDMIVLEALDLEVGVAGSSTLAFDFNSHNPSDSFDPLVMAENVTLNGSVSIEFANGFNLGAGSVPLIEYNNSFTGSLPGGSFTLGTRASGSLRLDASFQTLYLDVTADTPVWTGLDGSQWVVGSTGANGNWRLLDGGTATDYIEGDSVRFDDSAGAGNSTVTIASAAVSPNSTTFDNSDFDYTLTGAHGITGTGVFTKNGAGKVIVTNANSYSGATTIHSGTLQLGDGATNGSIAGTSGVANSGVLAYVTTSDQTAAYPIAGASGKVTKSGAGTLTLGGTNSFGNGLDISQGVVSVSAQANLGATGNDVTLDNGATLRTTHSAWWGDMGRDLVVGPGGGALDIAGQAAAAHGSRVVFWSGAAGALSGGGDLTITGDGSLNDVSGTGTLVLAGAYTNFTGDIIADQGATFEASNDTPVSAGSKIILGTNSQYTVANAHNVANDVIVNGTGNVIGFNNTAGTISGGIALNNDVTIGLRNWWDYTVAMSGTISGAISGNHGIATSRGTSAGTPALTLSGANTYLGDTNVAAGTTVTLAATGGLRFAIGAPGVNNKVTGAGTANLNGTFTFDLTGAAGGTNSWTIVDTAAKSFGITFHVAGFTESSDVWTMTSGTDTWTFDEATGVLSVAPAAGGFEDWIGGFGLAENEKDPTDDPDNDGVLNLMEYVLGRNPAVADGPASSSVRNGANLELTFNRSDLAVGNGDAAIYIQYGGNLAGWTQVAVPAGNATVDGVEFVISDGSPNDTVVARIPHAGAAKFFGRVKAVK